MRGIKLLDLKMAPKHHLLFHWAMRVRDLGNPDLYSTYEDEHVNGQVAKIAQRAHSLVWSRRVQSEYKRTFGGSAPFAKKARQL